MQKRSESEHADIDIGNQVADINLEMLLKHNNNNELLEKSR